MDLGCWGISIVDAVCYLGVFTHLTLVLFDVNISVDITLVRVG